MFDSAREHAPDAVRVEAAESAHGTAPGTALGQASALAVDILEDARASLMVAFRFMDAALWRMPFAQKHLMRPVASDGYRFYVDALRVVKRYRDAPNEVVRDYLHTVLHCVFRHPFDEKHPDHALWDISCDVAVEAIALELVGLRYPSESDADRRRAIEKLKKSCPQLTAQKIYRELARAAQDKAFMSESGLTPKFAASLQPLFVRDDHDVWTRCEERPQTRPKVAPKAAKRIEGDDGSSIKGESSSFDEDEEDKPSPSVNMPGAPAKSRGGSTAEGDVEDGDRLTGFEEEQDFDSTFGTLDDVPDADFSALSWKDITKQMEVDLESFAGKPGVSSETFLVNLSVANRKTYNYKDFLRRFSSMSEEMKVSPDEFDYVYYTYGLSLFKNMPLVEPLEYQESDRVRDFVIAVDTSGSCAGSLVRQFVEKTYDVLKSSEGFGRALNVHIVQCDCDIRKDTKVTCLADLDKGMLDYDVRGYGGTDFRPVFKYVDELIEQREFTNLKGLIYFTDGIGKYPIHPPDYETVFVFMNESGRDRVVPPWAMKVIMDEDEIWEL